MKYFLAPLGGISKLPFRRLCLHLGADLVWSEQINAGLLLKSSYSFNIAKNIHSFSIQDNLLLETHEEEKNKLVIQLASNEAAEASQAVNRIKDFCYGIDLNMDPPVPDPRGTGIGKNLLLNPHLASKIIEKIHQDHPEVKIFFKMRVLSTPVATIEFINLMQSSGAQYLILHMRKIEATLQEPQVDLEEVKSIVRNQQTVRPSTFKFLLGFVEDFSQNKSIMIGRGAAHYPGIFSLLKGNEDNEQQEEAKFEQSALRERIEQLNKEHSSLRPLLASQQLHYKAQYPYNLTLAPCLQKLKQYIKESDLNESQIKLLFSYILKSHSELAHVYFSLQTSSMDKFT